MMPIIWIGIALTLVIFLSLLVVWWISIYNKFIYWKTKAERKFADIDIIMQQRIDMIYSLAQATKKYSIHEWKALKETIEARSRWTKDTSLNEKIKNTQEIENNFVKLQAVFERYPKLKASSIYKKLMNRIAKIESKLRKARLEYNRVAQRYNERVRRFPRNIVAKVHGFKEIPYLDLRSKESYQPKEIFEE